MTNIIYQLMYLFLCDPVAVSTAVIFINHSVRNGYVSKDNADPSGRYSSPEVLNSAIQILEEITSLLVHIS